MGTFDPALLRSGAPGIERASPNTPKPLKGRPGRPGGAAARRRGDALQRSRYPLLDRAGTPAQLRQLPETMLGELAAQLREFLVESVARSGGHLSAGLGTVDLTIALHYIFDTPRDSLVWDVGHQCYPHKILTGRRDRIRTLRQEGGLSGFTKRSESEYDPFGAAHSSTSISAALGFAVGRDMGMRTGDAIAVIGDGAISAGMAYEAMNNAGHDGRRLFVILNDNEMSIAQPVGAMSKYLSGLYGSQPFGAIQKMAEGFESALPGPIRDHARRARALVTGLPGGQGTSSGNPIVMDPSLPSSVAFTALSAASWNRLQTLPTTGTNRIFSCGSPTEPAGATAYVLFNTTGTPPSDLAQVQCNPSTRGVPPQLLRASPPWHA